MNSKLVLMPNWIGDLALTLAAVTHKARQEDEDITLLAPCNLTALCRVLTSLPIIAYDRSSMRAVRHTLHEVRKQRFQSIYLIPYSFSSAWFAFRTRIPHRIGLLRDGRGVLLTKRLPRSIRDRTRHLLYEHALLLETDPISPQSWEGHPVPPREDYRDTIAVCPGAQYGPAKKWRHFGDLVEAFPTRRILVLGGQAERAEGDEIERRAPERVVNLAGKTALEEIPGILAGVSLAISNDSGLMHLAGYVGTPVIGIFGSTSPTWTSPLGRNARIVAADCSCTPCLDRTCRFGHYHCLESISIERVVSVANELLSEAAGSSEHASHANENDHNDQSSL